MQVPPARRVRAAAAAAFFTLAIALSASAQTPVSGRIHIDNFAKVNDSLYRGAQPQGSDYADLARLGVKTVVDLTNDDGQRGESASVEQQGMRYVHIPMDTHTTPTAQQIQQFLSLVDSPSSGPVYVHCVGGRHRTGVMTAVYRMTHDGISGQAAFQEMKQFKYGADFLHPEFKQFVQTYDAKRGAAAANANQQQ